MKKYRNLILISLSCILLSGCKPEHTSHIENEEYGYYQLGHWKTCEVCGLVLSENEHTFDETILKEPTCVEAGIKDVVCKVCGYTDVLEAPKLEHVISNEWTTDDDNHWLYCKGCNKKFSTGNHQWEEKSSGEQTFEKGITTVKTCKVCGLQKVINGEPMQHTYSTAWSQSETHHWHKCSDLQYDYLKQNYEEHDFDEGVINLYPTTTTTGKKLYTCKTCNYVKTEIIPCIE